MQQNPSNRHPDISYPLRMKQLLLFLVLLPLSLFAQGDEVVVNKHLLYAGFGRQGISYVKYELDLITGSGTQTVLNIGLGGIPGDREFDEARTNKLMLSMAQTISFKSFALELGLEPSFNSFGKVKYIDLNAIIGLRYYQRKVESPFFQAGYNPRLYQSFDSQIDVPFYVGLGMAF